jgi:hypothetical protein
MKPLLAAALLTLALAPAQAAESRCGWLVNPTPGNWWLTDKDATWILATQGIEAPDEVMMNVPEFDENEYVATNGNYGYGCACLSVDVDVAGERIVNVYGGKTLPLSRCESDEALPPPE